jgi:putative DNA primase/helicase
MYKKSVALISETNFGILNKTGLLKQLSSGDPISYEGKGLKGFTDTSYAKLIIATNSLPTSNDDSEGYYRRWLIIDFPNNFSEGKDIIDTIPEIEYNNLAKRICTLLPELLARGSFTNQGTIAQRKQKYIETSNPLSVFITKYCSITNNETDYILYSTLKNKYNSWLLANKKNRVQTKEFQIALENQYLEVRRTSFSKDGIIDNGTFIIGICFKETIKHYDEDLKAM